VKASVKLSSSKSLVNRHLILKAGHPELKQDWTSSAEDVQNLKGALKKAPSATSYYLGEGGTSLRFFAVYLSSFSGRWQLRCKKSLLERPQKELFEALNSLGAQIKKIDGETLELVSDGWQTDRVTVDAKDSTQVLTALVITALSKGRPLDILIREEGLNSDYFRMTLSYVRELGFRVFEDTSKNIYIPPQQKLQQDQLGKIESDWSSAAFLMVLASLKGGVCVEGLDKNSLQPDACVVDLLKSLGARSSAWGCIGKGSLPYCAFDINLQKSPDLFPVLAALACFCKGESRIYGAPQLKNKESNRIECMNAFVRNCGYSTQLEDGGLIVQGAGLEVLNDQTVDFDVSKDHRLYMASEIFRAMGYKINARGSESINKSFSEYETLKKAALACFF